MTSTWLVFFPVLLSGCASVEDDTGTPAAPTDVDDILDVGDLNNYHYVVALDLASVEIPYQSDPLTIWADLSVDMRGRPTADPSTFDRVTLAAFGLDQQGLLDALATSSLHQSDIRTYYLLSNTDGLTEAYTTQYSVIGNDFDPAVDFVDHGEAVWTWILTVWDENVLGGLDILSSIFLVPSETGTATQVSFQNDSALLDFSADLHSSEAVATTAGLPGYTMDWSALTVDAAGNEYSTSLGDQLLIGHLDVADVAAVEDAFLTALDAADQLYYLNVRGMTDADLSLAVDAAGAPFGGFTTDGVWIVGLLCTSCTSPAPLFLTAVTVVP